MGGKAKKAKKAGQGQIAAGVRALADGISAMNTRLPIDEMLGRLFPHICQLVAAFEVAEGDVPDIAQNVIAGALKAVRRGKYVRNPGEPLSFTLSAWLYGITWRLVNHHRYKAYRRREVADVTVETPGAEASVDPWKAIQALSDAPEWVIATLVLAYTGPDGIEKVATRYELKPWAAVARIREAAAVLRRALR